MSLRQKNNSDMFVKLENVIRPIRMKNINVKEKLYRQINMEVTKK